MRRNLRHDLKDKWEEGSCHLSLKREDIVPLFFHDAQNIWRDSNSSETLAIILSICYNNYWYATPVRNNPDRHLLKEVFNHGNYRKTYETACPDGRKRN